jgi:hypothetical protein
LCLVTWHSQEKKHSDILGTLAGWSLKVDILPADLFLTEICDFFFLFQEKQVFPTLLFDFNFYQSSKYITPRIALEQKKF